MSTPNYAFIQGSTPASGAMAAFKEGLRSFIVGVSSAIRNTNSGAHMQGAQTCLVTTGTCASHNIAVGTCMWVDFGTSIQECVLVTAVNVGAVATHFNCTFVNDHGTGTAQVRSGLPTLGVSNPWTEVTGISLPMLDGVFVSSQTTDDGDLSYIPILMGSNVSDATSFGLATADDLDSVTLTSPGNHVANYDTTNGINGTAGLQDTPDFLWWAVICEYGIVVMTLSSTFYNGFFAGALKTPAPSNAMGVGRVSGGISSGATTVTTTADISARLIAGQQVLIVNQSHDSTSPNFGAADSLMTLATVSTTTLTFTAPVPSDYDAGALIGAVTTNCASTSNGISGFGGLDGGTVYLAHSWDGSYTDSVSQTAHCDQGAISADMTSNESPQLGQQALTVGEIDQPIIQAPGGCAGYCYGFQLFPEPASWSPTDYYQDSSFPAVWKSFTGTNVTALGPITNPLNTAAALAPGLTPPWLP